MEMEVTLGLLRHTFVLLAHLAAKQVDVESLRRFECHLALLERFPFVMIPYHGSPGLNLIEWEGDPTSPLSFLRAARTNVMRARILAVLRGAG
jgi:hypothetical protein